jgi:hypothetical protein
VSPPRGVILLAATVTALIITAGTAAAQPTYGVVPQDGALPTGSDLERMPKAGIERVRLMASWATTEASPGRYEWTTIDRMVRESTERGIEPYLFLYGTPQWAARQDGHRCRGGACAVFAPRSHETRTAFARFAGAAADRYGPGGDFWAPSEYTPAPCGCSEPRPLRTWQLWNEQNSPKYFAPSVNVRRYASLLRSSSDAIRAADPQAEIVLGGMWGPGSAHRSVTPVQRYLQRLYRVDGIERSFDAIALHPYASSSRGSIEQVEAARKVVRRSGDAEVRLWISELGWAAKGPSKNPYVKGLTGQARLLARTLAKFERRARSFRLRGVFWYSWRDIAGGKSICEWCAHAGLRAKDGSAKPAWRAFARVARS